MRVIDLFAGCGGMSLGFENAFVENVYNIERFSTVTTLKQMLVDAGYGITTRVLDASRCGVPQKRHRFFLIGKLGEKNGFLDETLVSNLSCKQMTVRDYLGDALNTEFYYMHPRSYVLEFEPFKTSQENEA